MGAFERRSGGCLSASAPAPSEAYRDTVVNHSCEPAASASTIRARWRRAPPSAVASRRFSSQPSLAGHRWISKRKSRTVILRRNGEQAKEAAAHGFLRAEATTLRDTLDRRT